MIPGVKRVCLDCNTLTAHGSRCEPCQARLLTRINDARQKPPGYDAAHARIRRQRGPAKTQTCSCGQRAAEWALRHDGQAQRYAYSDNPDDYDPLCHQCHRARDTR